MAEIAIILFFIFAGAGSLVLAIFAQRPFRLQQTRDELEARVTERTAQLADAVERLHREIADRQRAEEQVRTLNITLEQRVIDRTRELAALYEVSAVASQATSLETRMAESLARTMVALRGDVGAIYLFDVGEEGTIPARLRRVAHQGIESDVFVRDQVLASAQSVFASVLVQGETLFIPDTTAHPRLPAFFRQGKPNTLVVAPLRAEGQIFGGIGLMRDAALSFAAEEIALLTSIADQIGLAVRSDRLRKQTVVLEERGRLARDLHDSITHSLYGLVAFAEAGQAHFETGSTESVGAMLARIADTTRQALKEMRLFIHELRPSVLEEEGLGGALHQRLAAVEGRSGVKARFVADENLDLPPPIQDALYYIAQEALNNTLKHAHAKSVSVLLRRENHDVILEIVDEGCGFDSAAVPKGGLGLVDMRERAEALGGAFTLTSASGEGTRVRVVLNIGG